MLNIIQNKLQTYLEREVTGAQVGFRKDQGRKDIITGLHWIIEKAKEY